MVNRGGPSRGCLTCIQRKIRCDYARPSCGQCRKSERRCAGYRNTIDSMFRDESKKTIERAVGTVPRASGLLLTSPSFDEQTIFINFFASNYVCNDAAEARSNLFWLPRNSEVLLADSNVTRSMECLGALSMARAARSSSGIRKAYAMYGRALNDFRHTWQATSTLSPAAVAVAMLFMAFFERLSGHDHKARLAYMAHLEGLAALLDEHWRSFVRTEFGARMFLQTRSQVIADALLLKIPVAPRFVHMSLAGRFAVPVGFEPACDVDLLLVHLAGLQAKSQQRADLPALVSDLRALELDFRHWEANVPAAWRFVEDLWPIEDATWWEARYDHYPAAITANVWNKVRAARLVIHDLVERAAVHTDVCTDSVCHQSEIAPCSRVLTRTEVQRIIIDTCASIPPYLRPERHKGRRAEAYSKPPMGTTFWYLWNLSVVASLREAPPALKAWCLTCLKQMHDMTGVVRAAVPAEQHL